MTTHNLSLICIDDDEFMLKAIGRRVRRLRSEWVTVMSSSPLEWQAEWDESGDDAPAIVISDLLMPKKRGDQLLSEVKSIFPDAIRVLLTGDASQSIPEEAHTYAHFVLPKPFTEEDFEHLFQCAERLHQMPFDHQCRRRLGTLADLPLLPITVIKLQKVIASPSCDIHKIADVVSHEPPLVARIFQLANSPFFGFRRTTESLPEAVGRLGATLIESLAVTQLNRIHHTKLSRQNHQIIADKALRTGSMSRLLAKQLKLSLVDQDKVFVASLLTSIGTLILLEQGQCSSQQESAHCMALQEGYCDHHIVAAYMLIMWGYDIDIGDIVLHQNHITFDAEDKTPWRASIIGLVSQLVDLTDQTEIEALLSSQPEEIKQAVSDVLSLMKG